MPEKHETDRRGFLSLLGATTASGWFTIDDDGDGEYLDDILGYNNADQLTVYVGTEKERQNTDAEEDALWIRESSEDYAGGTIFTTAEVSKNGLKQQEWQKLPSTGPNPELQSATVEGKTTTGSLDTDDGSIGGDVILGGPDASSSSGLTLGGGWTTVDSNNPTIIELSILTGTDGTTTGSVMVDVDESGGTSADYSFATRAEDSGGSNFRTYENISFYLPAGGQVQIANTSDPAGLNSVDEDRVVVL